jgi:hypothetical protein
MIFRKKDGLRRAAMTGSAAAVVCLVTLRLVAGERTAIGQRIQFSGADNAPELPQNRPSDKLPSKPFEFLDRNNSIGGVVAPLTLPTPGSFPNLPTNSKRRELFEQKLDEKRNWIYRTPNDLSHLATVNEMFGVREAETDGRSPKSRKSIERFFESKNTKPAADMAGDDWIKRDADKANDYNFDPDKRRSRDIGLRYTQPIDPGRMMTAGFSLPTDWSSSSATAQKPLNDATGFGSDRSNLLRERLGQADNFKRLLATPGINPMAAAFNPVNLRVDTTRQGYSPITPILPTQTGPPTLAGSLSGNDLNPLAEQGTKSLGPSSLSPVVSAPTGPAYLKPSPATVEFPQRKF